MRKKEIVRNALKIFVRKPKGKVSLRITMRRWKGNIKINTKEIGSEDMYWIQLTQDWKDGGLF